MARLVKLAVFILMEETKEEILENYDSLLLSSECYLELISDTGKEKKGNVFDIELDSIEDLDDELEDDEDE